MNLARKAESGFTVTELAVTVGIIAILLAIAAPTYQRFLMDSRMNAQASEFVTMLQFARSEAIKRNATITMCKSANGTGCTTSGAWTQGWIVFVDAGTVGTVDGSDTVLRVHAALSGGSTLIGATNVANYVSYSSNGQTAQSGQFDLCSIVQALPGRDIVVAAGTGRPSVAVDTAPVTCS